MPPSRERAGERGFTLIEVLVALVVTSLILAIVMNASLQAKSRSRAALEKEEAVTLARSLIAGRSVAPFEATPRTGESGGLGWTIAERAIATNPNGLLLLSEIRVSVRGPSGATLATLAARRIKAAPKP